ncbi:MAG: NAD(P)H-dependent oxidoreductase subunit E, partial [Actinobacteria bacterium]|nr:NAD(P)H-dependent oxidoreductase subunit E [Actinomycetota bacterium]
MHKNLQDMTGEEKAELVNRFDVERTNLLSVLLDLQSLSYQNYIDEETAVLVAKAAGIALSELYEVLSFYAMLSTEPRGRYVVEVCRCTPCTLADDVEVA